MNPRRRLTFLLIPGILLWILLYMYLDPAARGLTRLLFGSREGAFPEAFRFFVYEAPKVLMLLLLVVFAVGIFRTWVTPERTRRALAGRRELTGNVLASLLGVATPFCSCSAIPLFIGFVTSGVPLGVTFSFLVAAPMINEVALILLFALVGWKVALLYAGTGIAVAVAAGWILGRLRMEKHVEDWVYQARLKDVPAGTPMTWGHRLDAGCDAVVGIVGRVWPWVLTGIAAGALIHGWVPDDVLVRWKGAWWEVPAAVLMGVPLYSNAAGIVPVVQALLEKGAALGTALAFMMSVIALSLPEVMILKKVLKVRLILAFLATVTAGILCVGWLFNLLI